VREVVGDQGLDPHKLEVHYSEIHYMEVRVRRRRSTQGHRGVGCRCSCRCTGRGHMLVEGGGAVTRWEHA